jgi:hypothetical protein
MALVNDLSEALGAAWVENTRRVKGRVLRPGPRDYLTASNLSECPRAMTLDMLHPEDNPPFDDDTLERFYRGDDVETAKNARLHQVGMYCKPPFRVFGQQREVEIYSRDGKTLLIRGRVEGTLDFYTEKTEVDYEIKSGQAVAHIETFEDLLRNHWTRKYLRQFLAYLYAQVERKKGSGLGIFIIDKPSLPALIPLDLAGNDQLLEIAEATLRNAEWAVEARFEAREMPPFIDQPAVCQRCVHLGKSCHPPVDFGPGAQVDDDPAAALVLEEYIETQASHKTHERAKRYLFGDNSKPGRYRGRPMVLAGGSFIVQGRWGPYTRYEVPDEVKNQYKVVDEKGQWKAEVTRLASEAKD